MKLIIDIDEELYTKLPYLINKGSVLIRDILDAVEKATPLDAQPIHGSTYGGVSWGGTYRDATEEERQSVKDYIESISKPTGVHFYKAKPTDAVSREQALLALTGMDLPTDRDKLIALFTNRIQNLPSVTPRTNLAETSQDCVSILNRIMEYTYGMLTAEKIGLQHLIKSMMDDLSGGGEDDLKT